MLMKTSMAVCRNVALVFMLNVFLSQHHFIRCSTDDAQLSVDDILFVVLSQPNTYHVQRARLFEQELKSKVKKLSSNPPTLYRSHKYVERGAWTLFPILEKIAKEGTKKLWVFLCEEETRIDVALLIQNLKNYDHTKAVYLSQGLIDEERTIIHHYSLIKGFQYPDTAAGIVFSIPLIKQTLEREFFPLSSFSIDPKHELAVFFYDEGKGTALTPVDFLCAGRDTGKCATTYTTFFPQCGSAIPEEDMFVAVKTCKQFHETRIPIVKSTWGQETQYIEYYSEEADPDIPTVDLGVPNTERGHCAKLQAIFQRAASHPNIKNRKWLLVVDDDTIISLHRVRALLACYDDQELVAVGERYGITATTHGYDYITLGGGMAVSMPLVRELADVFRCPAPHSPDDMLAGMTLNRMGIAVTHSPLFHQARYEDYSAGYHSHQIPVSFHKYWENDPYKTYQEHLRDDIKGEEEKNRNDEL